MFHFDWGVFWAVLAAAAIAYAFFRSALDPQWHGNILLKSIELQERQLELQREQQETQEKILERLPF